MHQPFDIILVPQGAEYQAVCEGLQPLTRCKPLIRAIPVGSPALRKYLEQSDLTHQRQLRILIMGLCGSLSPRYQVGDVVIYQRCTYVDNSTQQVWQECDRKLTTWLQQRLSKTANLVTALTSNQVICSSRQKIQLAQQTQADVVDMEGATALEILSPQGIKVAMVRVVSDECNQDLPDLNFALAPDGSLQPVKLAWSLLKQPVAATGLIRGSLRALRVLRQVSSVLSPQL